MLRHGSLETVSKTNVHNVGKETYPFGGKRWLSEGQTGIRYDLRSRERLSSSAMSWASIGRREGQDWDRRNEGLLFRGCPAPVLLRCGPVASDY